MSDPEEVPGLKLLPPVPQEQLLAWLAEFYGKRVEISKRELLRHRDLSYVERLWIADSLPDSLIYKLVLPPWDVEKDLHERVLIPSISNSAQVYLSAHRGPVTALFIEDLGTQSLASTCDEKSAAAVGEDLAKMHRAYSYRSDELMQTNVLRAVLPLDYADVARALVAQMGEWNLVSGGEAQKLLNLARLLAVKLAGEPISIVHGDLFAENIILRGDHFFIIDWSWFTILGVPLMDLATVTMNHQKNGAFFEWKNEVIESYAFESARDTAEVKEQLVHAETLSRLLFLQWLVERRRLGILGTTVGAVEGLIPSVVRELTQRQEIADT